MEDLTLVQESKHKELMALMNPLIDFMIENDFSYFLVAGKDGVCTRHMRGKFDDVSGMLTGMMENNQEEKGLLKYAVESAQKNEKRP